MSLPSSTGKYMFYVYRSQKQNGKFALLSFCCLLFLRVVAQPPVINSFSPASGPIGTTVTINGTNFNPAAANNTVFFGAVKTVVYAASATSLTVTVPVGITFQPISVTTNNLTAYANQPFTVTFPSNSAGITPNSFAAKTDYVSGYDPGSVAVGDLDGDGKLDLVVTNGNENNISLLRNTSSGGNISFAAKLDIATGTAPYCVSISDLDGDGTPDLAIANSGAATVSLYSNQSTPGTLSFAARQDYAICLVWLPIPLCGRWSIQQHFYPAI